MSIGPRRSKISRPPKPVVQPLPAGAKRPGVPMWHERLIGRLIVDWAVIEALMQEIIWAILDIDISDGRIITARMDARRKMQWLRSFSKKHLEDDSFNTLADILDGIELLQDDRNFIVHGTWATMQRTGIPIAASLREKSDPDKVVSETFPMWRMQEITGNAFRL